MISCSISSIISEMHTGVSWCIGKIWKEWGEKWGPIICSHHIMLSETQTSSLAPPPCSEYLLPNNYDIWLGPVWGMNCVTEQTLTFRFYYLLGIGDICKPLNIQEACLCYLFSQDGMCLFKNDLATLSPLPIGSFVSSLGFYITLMLLFWCM